MDSLHRIARFSGLRFAAPVGALICAVAVFAGVPAYLYGLLLIAVAAAATHPLLSAGSDVPSPSMMAAVAPMAGDLLAIVDPLGEIEEAVAPESSTLGYSGDALVGRNVGDLVPRTAVPKLTASFGSALRQTGHPVLMRSQVRLPNGRWRDAELTITAMTASRMLVGLRDMSGRTELEGELMRQAYSDPLTGLANRSLFQSRVQQAVKSATGPKQVAVLFVDLDGFKSVNDTLGHALGDELLTSVARRLAECVRGDDLVARLGGDEFAVLVTGPDAEASGLSVAERIGTSLRQPMNLAGRAIAPGGSTGIAIADTGHETAEQLLRNADLAMYRAKSRGDSGFARYEDHMHQTAVARVQAETDLRQAIANGDLVLHYQPVVNLATGRVVGVEALVRWVHASKGLLSPAVFIDLAEETGLVREIGSWAIQTACHDAMRWQPYAEPGTTFHVSVNVSARQLDPELIDIVRGALKDANVPPGVLMLEVTESVFADAPEEAAALLRRLRSDGVKIALDDFGTGYSSLSYLTRLPVDVLKVDKSFVRHLGGNQRTGPGELTRTILQLCRSLHLGAIAEGVETAQQRQALLQMGCGFAQGFLFAAAMRADAILDLLASGQGVAAPMAVETAVVPEATRLPIA